MDDLLSDLLRSARRFWPLIATLVLVGATLSPILRKPEDDGYPLSTYPMFAFRRPTKMTMDYAFGVAADGTKRPIRPWHVGSQEVLQARSIIERAVRGGVKTQKALCDQIATRVAADPFRTDIVEIRIVTGTHDAVEYLVRHVEGKETQRSTCKVPRTVLR